MKTFRLSLYALAMFTQLQIAFAPSPAASQPFSIYWQKYFGGAKSDVATSITATDDGGYVVAGYSLSSDGDVTDHHGSNDQTDFWILKIDRNGAQQWNRSLGGSSFDEAMAVAQSSTGNIFVAGASRSTDGDITHHHGATDFADAWIVNLRRDGTVAWQRSLGGSDFDAAYALTPTSDGGVVIAGESNSNDGDVSGHHGSAEFSDAWVVRLNSSGDIVWQSSIGGSDNDAAHAVVQTHDGGFVIAGASRSNDGDCAKNNGGDDLWIAKLDFSGTPVWSRTAGGSANDGANAVIELPNGKVVAAGYSFSDDGDVHGHHGTNFFSDEWIVRFDSAGELLDEHSFGGTRNDVAQALTMVRGELVVAGSSESHDGDVGDHHGGTSPNAWVITVDSSGILRAEKSFGQLDAVRAAGIASAGDGAAWVVAATSRDDRLLSWRHEGDDFYIIKLGMPAIAAATPLDSTRQIEVYPNPFTMSTTVHMPADALGGDVTVYDLSGHEMKKFINVTTENFVIMRDNLRTGTYILDLTKNGMRFGEVKLMAR